MKPKKLPLWIPYPSFIKVSRQEITLKYKGGETTMKLSDIHSIMFYGSLCDLSEDFISTVTAYNIPVAFHKRNMHKSTWILPSISTSKDDILTNHILFRNNIKKRTYVTKRLLIAKFKSMTWLIPEPAGFKGKHMTIEQMVAVEAWHAKRYWQKFYKELGHSEFSRRGKIKNTVSDILNAVSKFVGGIILRWITYHNISPYHGFLHIPTDYPALLYDLMEPYRGYIDQIVFNAIKDAQEKEVTPENYLAWTLETLKEKLDEKYYIPETRQIVTFHELLHGIVLALCAYLRKDIRRFTVPQPGRPNGGRPIHAGYRLYGRSAGPTDFWTVAKEKAYEPTPLINNNRTTST